MLSYNMVLMKERRSCVGVYCMEKGKHCSIALQIRHQAKYGSLDGWTPDEWGAYIKRVRDNVLPLCEHPKELGDAINNTRPILKGVD